MYIDVGNKVKIFYEDINPGSDETIVFIHGWPLSHKMFEYQIDWLSKQGIRCVAMDLRGFGSSDKPWNGYDYDTLADDVHKLINELNLNNFSLLGYSMGGAVAANYILKYSNVKRIKRLILLGAALPVFTQKNNFPYGQTDEAVNTMIANARADKPSAFGGFTETVFGTGLSPEFLNWFSSVADEASLWSAVKALETLRDSDFRNSLRNISIPTAILHGTDDKVCPFPLAQETMRLIENSTLIPFENVGHGLFFEKKDEVNKAIMRFVSEPFESTVNVFNTPVTRKKVPPVENKLLMHYKFVNPPLSFDYAALEPFIDERTMRIHHDKHLGTYIDNLNKAIAPYSEYHSWPLEKLIYMSRKMPESIRLTVERNAGGVYNHFFYFDSLSPRPLRIPEGKLAEMISKRFGSFTKFKEEFSEKAMSVFGSGYAWLVLKKDFTPEIITTINQETPLNGNYFPLVNIDVWEHAYYLKHYNLKADYIKDWFNVVNWKKVQDRFASIEVFEK